MQTQITIKGQEYALGEVAFSEENIDLLEKFLTLFNTPEAATFSDMAQSGILRNFYRILKDCLIEGSGPEKAAEAMGKLAIDFSDGSDMTRAIGAVVGLISGGE